jgi:hypothetical protein
MRSPRAPKEGDCAENNAEKCDQQENELQGAAPTQAVSEPIAHDPRGCDELAKYYGEHEMDYAAA